MWWLDLRAAYPLEVVCQSPVLRRGAGFALLVMLAMALFAAATGRVARRLGARPVWVAALASLGVLALRRPLQGWLEGFAPDFAGGLALLVAAASAAALAAGAAAARWLPPRWLPPLGVAAVAAFGLAVDAGSRAEAALARPVLVGHGLGMGAWILAASGGALPRAALAAAVAAALALPAALAIGLGNPAAPRMRPTRGPERPDVVLILVDTLRADRAELERDGRPAMPALRALAARDATWFRRAYAPAPATRPSVRALFTAERPGRWTSEGPPAPETWNLATAFRESGYRTAAFSASAVIDAPGFRSGFDEFWSSSGRPLVQRSLLIRGLVCGRRRLCDFELAGRLRLHKEDGSFIRRRVGGWLRSAPRPAFLYIHLYDPHWPYYDRGFGFRDAELARVASPHRDSDLLGLAPGDPANAPFAEGPAHAELASRYLEEVRHADAVLEGILGDLRAAGRYDSSLIAVLGDHGEEFFEHLGFGHGHDVYEEQLRVPLVLKWPREPRFAGMPPRLEEPVSLVDLFPTLGDLLSLRPPPAPLRGRSLRGLLEGRPGAAASPVLAAIARRGRVYVAYREGPLKVRLVHAEGASPLAAPAQVFDLEADPGERRPLPAARHPELVERARQLAHADWLAARGRAAPRRAPGAGGDEVLEQLRALGYLDEDE